MIGQVILLAGSVYYTVKKKGIEGWLMIIGSLLGLLTNIFQTFLFPFIIAKKELDSVKVVDYYYVFYGLNIFFSVLFGVGFIMLILKFVKK